MMHSRGTLTLLALAVVLLHSAVSRASLPASEACEAAKLKAVSRYSACRFAAERDALIGGGETDYSRCEEKFEIAWARAEANFAPSCPSSSDAAEVRTAIDLLAIDLSSHLGGSDVETCSETLAQCTTDVTACHDDLGICEADLAAAMACGNAAIDAGEDCDQANLNGQTCAGLSFQSGVLRCGSGCVFDTSLCIAPPAPKLIFTAREEIWVGDNQDLGFLQYPSRGDVICQRLADRVPAMAGKIFHALLCGREPDVAGNAFLGLRERTTDSAGGYVRTDGAHVADNLDDLLDGSIENPISMDQDGLLLPDVAAHNVLPVWTGCRADGSSYDYDLQCSGVGLASWWFRSGIVEAVVGDPTQTDGRWLNSAVSSCGPPRHIYCIEQ